MTDQPISTPPGDERAYTCEECGHHGRPVANVVRGVYDGALFWSCVACGYAWPRFTDAQQEVPGRVQASATFADAHNARRVARGEA